MPCKISQEERVGYSVRPLVGVICCRNLSVKHPVCRSPSSVNTKVQKPTRDIQSSKDGVTSLLSFIPRVVCAAAVWGRYGQGPGCRDPPVPSGRRERPVTVSSVSSHGLPGRGISCHHGQRCQEEKLCHLGNNLHRETGSPGSRSVALPVSPRPRLRTGLPGSRTGAACTWTLLANNQPVCHRF